MIFVWSEEIRNNLSSELELQLDNKKFFNAKDFYSATREEHITEKKALGNIIYEENSSKIDFDYTNTVKGISFSNKYEMEKKQQTIDELSLEKRRIYKIDDLISANLVETIVIPYNVQPAMLALVSSFNWKDILLSDVSTALKMIKNKYNLK